MTKCENFATEANKRILIQNPVDVESDYGGFTRTFADITTVWAVVTPLSGREYFAQQALQTNVSHKFLIRYQDQFADPTVTSDYRIVMDGKYFAFKYSRNLEKDMKRAGKDFIEIFAEENAPDASTS